MKKSILSLVLIAFFSLPSFAQYWTTITHYDPFTGGDKFIGLNVGTGWWFGPSEARIVNSDGVLRDYTPTKVSRPPLNPTISLHYKRMLQNNRVDWGNSQLLSYSRWGGTVEGAKNDTTFSTKYSFSEVTYSNLFYVMVPIGDQIHINAGFGLTIGLSLRPKDQTVTFSTGLTAERNGGLSFQDILIGKIHALVGFDYDVSEIFTITANIIACPWDIFGSVISEQKNMHCVGDGLYVNNMLPFQLTVGFTYSL